MSSPHRTPDRFGSPGRASPSRSKQRERLNSHLRSHRDSNSQGSPTATLLQEFSRVVLDDDRSFRKALDTQDAEQERLHREALRRSLAEHEAVRQAAERARERVELEIERARSERVDLEKRELEEARRQAAESEAAAKQRQLDELKRIEQQRQRVAALEREKADTERRIEAQKKQEAEDAAAKLKAEKDQEEADRKAREEAAAKKREQEAQAQAQAQKPQPPAQQPNGITPASSVAPQVTETKPPQQSIPTQSNIPPGLASTVEQREAIHNSYLELHKRLKQMREYVSNECKKDARMKTQLGDWRRQIRACIGQQSKVDKVGNKTSVSDLSHYFELTKQTDNQ